MQAINLRSIYEWLEGQVLASDCFNLVVRRLQVMPAKLAAGVRDGLGFQT